MQVYFLDDLPETSAYHVASLFINGFLFFFLFF